MSDTTYSGQYESFEKTVSSTIEIVSSSTIEVLKEGLSQLDLVTHSPYLQFLFHIKEYLRMSFRSIEFSEAPYIGKYMRISIDANVRDALNFWEELVDEVYPKVKMPIFVIWSGMLDLSPEELGQRVGKVLAKMDISPLTLIHSVNIVEELRKEWE
jgi:hypothetical protein